MKTAYLLIIIIISSLFVAEASLLGKLFGRKRAGQTTVGQDLIDAKNAAYKAWLGAQKGLSDMSNVAWETLYDTYEATWIKYEEARLKVSEQSHKTLDEAKTDYEKAKSGLKDAQNKLLQYLERYKNKAEDMTQDEFFTGLEAAEKAVQDARGTFHKARDTMAGYYDAAYEQAVEDYNSAAEYLNDAAERVKNFGKHKTRADYEKTKSRLEKAREKAKESYSATKNKFTTFKQKLDAFNTEISDYVKEYIDFAKNRASWAANWLKTFKDDVKAQASKNYHQVLGKIQNIERKTAAGVEEAENAVKWVADRTSQYATDVFASIKAKYHNLKDEL